MTYLKTQVKVRNADKFHELCDYLEKHQCEVISYDKRRRIGNRLAVAG
ncbi:hypothetical protein IFO70_28580 [Phormidium tenue FACHB-886]|nr:hypothetical protein [Phormidium tenue FACHB-886]